MNIGTFLPLFRSSPDAAIEASLAAEARGLDGVFVFDHLFPTGNVSAAALSPLPVLGAVASETERIRIGTLVSRVGVVSKDAHLETFVALREVSGSRLIAGVGIGGREANSEHLAYGIPVLARSARLRLLEETCTDLVGEGIETWVGGRNDDIHDVARRVGAAINVWGEPVDVLPSIVDARATWAGSLEWNADGIASWLVRLADDGFEWGVVLLRGVAKDPVGAVSVLADAVDVAVERRMRRIL